MTTKTARKTRKGKTSARISKTPRKAGVVQDKPRLVKASDLQFVKTGRQHREYEAHAEAVRGLKKGEAYVISGKGKSAGYRNSVYTVLRRRLGGDMKNMTVRRTTDGDVAIVKG